MNNFESEHFKSKEKILESSKLMKNSKNCLPHDAEKPSKMKCCVSHQKLPRCFISLELFNNQIS